MFLKLGYIIFLGLLNIGGILFSININIQAINKKKLLLASPNRYKRYYEVIN